MNKQIIESSETTMGATGRKSLGSTESLQNNVPSKKKRKQFKHIKLEIKLKVIEQISSGKTCKNVAEEFGINVGNVSYIMLNKERYIEQAKQPPKSDLQTKKVTKKCSQFVSRAEQSSESGSPAKKIVNPVSLYKKLDDCLNDWLDSMHIKRFPISVPEFQLKALEVHDELKETYDFDAGYDWVCAFEERWDRKLVHDITENLSDKENISYQVKFKKANGYDQNQRAYRADLKDVLLQDASNLGASGNIEEQSSIICESQQNTKCSMNEFKNYGSTLSYKLTFSKCKRLLTDPDVSKYFSDDEIEELKTALENLISTMTSVENLFNKLLMNKTWNPFGDYLCLEDIAWVCRLEYEIEEEGKVYKKNKKAVLCTVCYEKLKDNYQMHICKREIKSHQLNDRPTELKCRMCCVCRKSTLHSRPAAECIACIIAFWRIKCSL